MNAPLTHRQLSFAGEQHRVTDYPGRAPTICALHGFTGSGEDFELLALHLRRSLAAPDLSGHGPLAKDKAITMESECERLEALLREFQSARILLGYSLGARTALSWALHAPSSFAALILIGGSPGLENSTARDEREFSDRALAERIQSEGISAFASYWEELPIISSQRSIRAPYGEALRARRRSNCEAGLAASLRGMGTGAQPSLWRRLPELQLPTLLITGSDDAKFDAIARQMVQHLPDARHVSVAEAGHCVHLEQPEATATAIDEFLAEEGVDVETSC